jgi:hypothetical protein
VIEERVSRAVGSRVVRLRRIQSGGYAAAFHAIAELEDDSTAFVKAGAEEVTSEFLLTEIPVYRALQAPFMPAFLGADEADPPILVLEDLTDARWPPPWDDDAIAAVVAALDAVHSTAPPDWLPEIEDERAWLTGGWAEIERDPAPFLSLGDWSADWLRVHLAPLREAAENAPLAGDSLVHLDVRSDNLCIADRGAVIFDWNLAHRGNPDLDLACWAPSLRLEGGPPPHEILTGSPELAAALAGFFASRAGLPPPQTAPQVRSFQLAQAQVAIPWALRELGLRSDA